jgi:hypothetical protein
MSKLVRIVKKGETWFTALNVALTMLKAQRFVLTAALLFTARALKADLTGDTDSMHVNITVFTEEAEHLQP